MTKLASRVRNVFGVLILAYSGLALECNPTRTLVDTPNSLKGVTSVRLVPEPLTSAALAVDGAPRLFNIVDQNNRALNREIFQWDLRDASNTGPATQVTFVQGTRVQCVAKGGGTVNVQALADASVRATASVVCEMRTMRMTLEPVGKTLASGASFGYRAELLEPDGTPPIGGAGASVVWASSDPTIASISSAGLVTALRPGPVTITASSTVTATPATSQLVITPNATIRSVPAGPATDPANTRVDVVVGATRDFAVLDVAGTPLTTAFLWSSSDVSIATMSTTGRATCLLPGNVLIRADAPPITASTSLSCVPFPATLATVPTGPTDDPAKSLVRVPVTGTRDYVVLSPTGAVVTTPVTWSSSNTSVATISPSTGHAVCISIGGVTITATNLRFVSPSTTLICSANVQAIIVSKPAGPPSDPPNTAVGIAIGSSRDFEVRDAEGVPLTGQITWSSSNIAVATVAATPVAAVVNGRATCVAPGQVTIRADGFTNFLFATAVMSCVTTVVNGPVKSMELVIPNQPVPIGATRPLTLTYRNAAGEPTGPIGSQLVEWSISFSGIAQEEKSNGVSQIRAKQAGTTEVQAVLRNADGTLAAITKTNVTVVAGNVAGIYLEPSAIVVTLPITTMSFTARLVDIAGNTVLPTAGATIRYKSSVPAVMLIDPATGNAIASSAGQASVTADYISSDGTTVLATTAPTSVNFFPTNTNSYSSVILIPQTTSRVLHVNEEMIVEAQLFDTRGSRVTSNVFGGIEVKAQTGAPVSVTLKGVSATGFQYTVKALGVPATSALANIGGVVTVTATVLGATVTIPLIIVP